MDARLVGVAGQRPAEGGGRFRQASTRPQDRGDVAMAERRRGIDLDGVSVNERLGQQTVLPAQSAAERTAYLRRLNRGSFENELAENQFVVASPAREDLGPGTVLLVRAGVMRIDGTA